MTPQPHYCPHKIAMTACGDCNYTHSDCPYQVLKWDGEMIQKMLCGFPACSRPAPTPDKLQLLTDEAVKAIKAQARGGVLGLTRDMYGLMMCVEKSNTDEFMEYYASKMQEFKEKYESLRTEAPKEQAP